MTDLAWRRPERAAAGSPRSPRCAADATRPRRRGDRVGSKFAALHMSARGMRRTKSAIDFCFQANRTLSRHRLMTRHL
jgi:hypothetical protein